MKNTTRVGDIAASKVLSALLITKQTVLLPFGDGNRYDLVFEENDKFYKVQCKNGLYRDGAVTFRTYSVDRNAKRKDYQNDVDYFGVYCSDLDTVYLIPIEQVPSSSMSLRIDAPKNGQKTLIKWASDYVCG